MEEKRFFDVFGRYSPCKEYRELLERGHSAKFKYIKNPMQVEVEMSFDAHEDAELIYAIEVECRTLYNAQSFKIIPHFPPEAYSIDRFNEIAYEAALCGAVTQGFFADATYSDDGQTVTVYIPFFSEGVAFVKIANLLYINSKITSN